MVVKRIVANIATSDVSGMRKFYIDVLELDTLMDMEWIATFGAPSSMPIQISVASEGGSGTPVPGISIEVEDVDDVHNRMTVAGFIIEYGPVDEPWGVRRFYVRDPAGTLVNILSHNSKND